MPLAFKPVELSAAQVKKAAKAGVSIDSMELADRYYGGPELKSLALEYLLCSNVLLLSRIYHLFGKEKNGKSTLAIDWLNRFFLNEGGSGLLVETENKMNTALFHRMLQGNYAALQQSRVTTLENAQVALTEFAKAVRSDTRKKRLVYAGTCIDSFRVSSRETVENTVAAGSASRGFPVEANKWRTYLGSFMDLIQDMPIALIVVNHARDEAVDGTAIKVQGCGGGTALKFLESYRILVKTIGRTEKAGSSRSTLELVTTTNSNGPCKRKIHPEIVYRDSEEEGDRVYVDWAAADADLLAGDDPMFHKSALAKAEVCAVKASSEKGLYNDDILGLKKVPITEIIAALYADPERLAKFREIEQITTYKNLEQLYEAGWFFDSAKLAKSDEDDD